MMRRSNTGTNRERGVMERSVKVNGEAALKIGDGHKMTFEEWNKMGIELNNEWEHIATHV